MKALPCLVFLAIFGLAITAFLVSYRNRRREETAIRLWADRHGYSIVRMRPMNTSVWAAVFIWVAGWWLFWLTFRRGWMLDLRDSQDGELTRLVYVRRGGQVEEHEAY